MLNQKACDRAEIKLFEGDNGSFSGYGSTFGNKDRANEIVVRGAFAKSLDAFLRDGFIAVGHDWSALPVATIKSAFEDETGLKIEAEFHSTPDAQSARRTVQERLERGKSVGLSIGYRVKDYEDTAEGRFLKEIELHEVSLVTVPCNARAAVTGAKDSTTTDGVLLDGLPADAHGDAALAAVETYLARAKAINELREKDGRVLSAEHRRRVAEIRDHADALLAASEPKTEKADPGAALAAFAHYQRTLARLNGVGVTE